jgi:aminoglycoside/choline kinase family phosphotransferase
MQFNTTSIAWSDSKRQNAFQEWLTPLCKSHHLNPQTLRLASADASFRRYFRIDKALSPANSLIIMDAPPDLENSHGFVKICHLMREARLLVPDLLDWQETHGFLLLSDLGKETMMQALSSPTGFWGGLTTAPGQPNPILEPNEKTLELFKKACAALITWQVASKPHVLPDYDRPLLLKELDLFHTWYLTQNKNLDQQEFDQKWATLLHSVFEQIVKHNLSTPSVFVHRDFMPRNLMLSLDSDEERLGVLDFQDSVYGPITYDIASLMRDAFVSWPEEFILDVSIRYWELAKNQGLLDQNGLWNDFGAFYREIEWMGLQRHLKVAGIFSRLSIRDHKHHYAKDIPRFINYIRSTCFRYRELGPFLKFIDHVEQIKTHEGFAFGRV